MDIFLLIIIIILLFLGLLGCIIPAIPGPILAYIGLFLFSYTSYADIHMYTLLIRFIIIIAVSVIDIFLPAWTAKKYGSSRLGEKGGLIGTFVGIPFGIIGIILGPFIGALIGELISSRNYKKSIQSALSSFMGLFFGIIIKYIVVFVIIWIIIRDLL